jgi:hypothetical protein
VSILACNIRDITQRYKQNEKEHYIKVKDFHGEDEEVKGKKKHIEDD